MIQPDGIKKWAESLFPEYLRSTVTGEPFFPRRKGQIGKVAPGAALHEFAAEVQALWDGSKNVTGRGYTVHIETHNRRSRGMQNEPSAVSFETEEDYLAFAGRTEAAFGFREDTARVLRRFPAAGSYIEKHVPLVLAEQGSWDGILSVVEYLSQHPLPGCYVRALPVSVHTKFIENHTEAIESLLADVCPAAIRPGMESFALRCGMKEDESLVRGRFLCPELQRECGYRTADVSLPVSAWATMPIPASACVVGCENKANFLSLPSIPNTLALFGGGGAAGGHFRSMPWLRAIRFFYWGDLDPCGLNILAQLRRHVPEVRSIFMDAETLAANQHARIAAKLPPGGVLLDALAPSERQAADALISAREGIEQERLLFSECLAHLVSTLSS